MRTTTHIVQFLLAAILVIALGGLAGWYFFVQRQIDSTERDDAARSFGSAPTFGQSFGSTYQNLVDGLTGGFAERADTLGEGKAAPRLWRVSAVPVAGAGFSGTTTALYFAERATGNVLLASPETSTILRLTNTLLPKAHEAQFAADGSVVLRFVTPEDRVTTFAATLASTTPSLDSTKPPVTLSGIYLPQDISAIAAMRDAGSLMYLVQNPSGGVVGATAEWNGTRQTRIYDSPLSGWLLSALPDGTALLTQKPADNIPGYAFILEANGTVTPLIGGQPGLTVLPQGKGGALLYSTSANASLTLFAQASPSASPVRLPVRTVTDKCVWRGGQNLVAYCAVPAAASDLNFLRDWYRGAIHTTDAWWIINASAGTAEILYTPPGEYDIDVREPSIDASGTYLSFINGVDRSLWMLRITE